MSAAILERSRELARVRGADAEARYEQLVDRLAGGATDVLPEDVVAVAEAAGRSLDELQVDLQRVEQRALARAEAAKLPGVLARLAEVEQERAALRAEFEAAQRRTADRDAALAAELSRLQATAATIGEHKRKLEMGAFDSAAEKARRAEASKALAATASVAGNLRTELAQAERRLAGFEQALAAHEKGESTDRPIDGHRRAPDAQERDRLAAEVAGAQRHVNSIKRQLEPLEAEIAAANKAIAELAAGQAA